MTAPDRANSADSAPDEPTLIERVWVDHIAGDTTLLDRLIMRHRERQRRYHRIEHVEAVVRDVLDLADNEAVDDRSAVLAAALYHDAIYEPQHPANERASARLARRDLTSLGWSPDRTDRVTAMIEGTKTHRDAPDIDTAVLFDADLSILSADEPDYDRYVTAVRAEYSHVDDREWAEGRSDVLQGFLDRDTIYSTSTGRQRWEATARANLTAEVASFRT